MLPMWLPDGLVDLEKFSDNEITFENLCNLINVKRAWGYGKGISVLDHSYMATIICAKFLSDSDYSINERNSIILSCMFHDIEESYTGDIPTPLKSKDIRVIGDDVRNKIIDYLNLPKPTDEEYDIIKLCDIISLIDEVSGGYPNYEELYEKILEKELINKIRKVTKVKKIHNIYEVLKWIFGEYGILYTRLDELGGIWLEEKP